MRHRTRAQRFARVATRTCLARGLVQSSADVPRVTYHGVWQHKRRKPLVPAVIVFQAEPEEDRWITSTESAAVTPGPADATEDAPEQDLQPTNLEGTTVERELSPEAEAEGGSVSRIRPNEQLEKAWEALFARVAVAVWEEEFPESCSPMSFFQRPVAALEVVKGVLHVLQETNMNALQEGRSGEPLFSVCLAALEKLAESDARNASGMISMGGVVVLAQVAAVHKQDEDVQHSICKVLWALIVQAPNGRPEVASYGGYQAVFQAMVAHPGSLAVQLVGCKVLKELAAKNVTVQRFIVQSGAIDTVLSAMGTHRSSASLQEAACGVLRNVSIGNTVIQNRICALGGVSDVLAALSTHQEEENVQWAGCWAIFCLVVRNDVVREDARCHGALQHVLSAMNLFCSVPKVQEAGCWALKALSIPGESCLQLAARVRAVALAMEQHSLEDSVTHAGQAAMKMWGQSQIVPRQTSRAATQKRSSRTCSLETIEE